MKVYSLNLFKFGRPKSEQPVKAILFFLIIFTPYFYLFAKKIGLSIDLMDSFSWFSLGVLYPIIAGVLYIVYITFKYETELFAINDKKYSGFKLIRIKYKNNTYTAKFIPPMIENFDKKKWMIVLLLLITIQLLILLPSHKITLINFSLTDAIKSYLFILFTVALVEEILFRGVWFWASGEDFFLSVVLGTLLFGALHFSNGLLPGFVGLGLGFVYASARWRGASILSLALVHTFFNWQHRNILRVEYSEVILPYLHVILICGYFLIGLLVLYIFPKDQRVLSKH